MPIEKLLQWAYGEQRVHLNLEGNGLSQITGDGGGFCLAVVDGSHNDALTLDLLVSGMMTGALVRKHGIAGTQPDWRREARHRLAPKAWTQGRSTKLPVTYRTVRFDDHRGRKLGLMINDMTPKTDNGWFYYTEIVEVDSPQEVDHFRAIYREWIAALSALRDTLRIHTDSLTDYAVSDMLPPERPWESLKTQRILYAEKRSLTTA